MRSLARLSVCRLTSLVLRPIVGFLGDAADVGLGKCCTATFIMDGFRPGDLGSRAADLSDRVGLGKSLFCCFKGCVLIGLAIDAASGFYLTSVLLETILVSNDSFLLSATGATFLSVTLFVEMRC